MQGQLGVGRNKSQQSTATGGAVDRLAARTLRRVRMKLRNTTVPQAAAGPGGGGAPSDPVHIGLDFGTSGARVIAIDGERA